MGGCSVIGFEARLGSSASGMGTGVENHEPGSLEGDESRFQRARPRCAILYGNASILGVNEGDGADTENACLNHFGMKSRVLENFGVAFVR